MFRGTRTKKDSEHIDFYASETTTKSLGQSGSDAVMEDKALIAR